ncbi:hypothetical protein [Chlamydiifrater phoenicopteri]|uniref:hypothetical protein n=1 Tax=Chlamydiifrater phoenicopteri TaxID=2681469 RepID=UPI001BCEC40C|nr:hypothetical protein [Chlamydiifrater phoenicopteri]
MTIENSNLVISSESPSFLQEIDRQRNSSSERCWSVVFRVGSFAIALLVTLFYLFLVMFLFGMVVNFCLRAMIVVSFFIAGVALALLLNKCVISRYID